MASAGDNEHSAVDKQGFEACLSHLIITPEEQRREPKEFTVRFPEGEQHNLQVRANAVCEELFKLIRKTGTIKAPTNWAATVNSLSDACQFMFGTEEAPQPPQPPPEAGGAGGDGAGGDGAGGSPLLPPQPPPEAGPPPSPPTPPGA